MLIAMLAITLITLSGCSNTNETIKTTDIEKDDTKNSQPISFDWAKLESEKLSISFEYPLPAGEATFFMDEWPDRDFDPTGTSYGWSLLTTEGWRYTIAGGVSNDFMAGREGWFTDSYQLIQEQDKYYLDQPFDRKTEISPLKAVERDDELIGLIYEASFEPFIKGTKQAAILNFPNDFHPKLASITFYFHDKTPLEDIEKVIRSVEISE